MSPRKKTIRTKASKRAPAKRVKKPGRQPAKKVVKKTTAKKVVAKRMAKKITRARKTVKKATPKRVASKKVKVPAIKVEEVKKEKIEEIKVETKPLKQGRRALVKKSQGHEKDSGSTEVQIALITGKINDLVKHLKDHPKDFDSRQGLLKMVGRRRRLLRFLRKANETQYQALIKELKLRQ